MATVSSVLLRRRAATRAPGFFIGARVEDSYAHAAAACRLDHNDSWAGGAAAAQDRGRFRSPRPNRAIGFRPESRRPYHGATNSIGSVRSYPRRDAVVASPAVRARRRAVVNSHRRPADGPPPSGRGNGRADRSGDKASSASTDPNRDGDGRMCNNRDRGGTVPINARATNAILSQMTSPPNILTMSRLLATPYLSHLIVSHRQKSIANPATDVNGFFQTDEVASRPIQANEAMDVTAAAADATATSAADAVSTVSANVDHMTSTPAIALSLFLAMGFTDFLDGYIARTYPSTATVLGTYLDPIADKFFISVMSLTLWHVDILPGMLVGLWVARDVGIVGSVYWLVKRETIRKQKQRVQRGDEQGADETEDVAVLDPQRMPLKVQASFLSKVNTTLQIGLIALGIAGEVPSIDVPPEAMTSLVWITAGTTICSSLGYLDGSALKRTHFISNTVYEPRSYHDNNPL